MPAFRRYGITRPTLCTPNAKATKPGLFGVFTGRSAPDPLGPELIDAYRGWVYACVNAITE